MLYEPTTLASVAALIAETLESSYNRDPQPVFQKAGLDYQRIHIPGARFPVVSMHQLWAASVEATGDPSFGLAVGKNIRPTTFHALGYAWLASDTLLESLKRLCRYYRIIATVNLDMKIEEIDGHYRFTAEPLDDSLSVNEPGSDAFMAAIISLCRQASDSHFAPLAVHCTHEDRGEQASKYTDYFQAPVTFGAPMRQILFSRESLETPVPGRNNVLAISNDQVVEEYLEVLDPHKVATEVRKALIQLLPSGEASQEKIARQLHTSLSSLQRRLQAEGTSYREIRDTTRRSLAEKYVREQKHSLCQIAYLLGFSDQSSFSRAFRRWTGASPREYRNG